MNTVQVKLPGWIQPFAAPLAPWGAAAKPASDSAGKPLQLSAEESARFVRIVSECGRIRRHYDIFRWLGGEVQHVLPHAVLLSAWGDFGSGELKLDVTSALPGVRTAELAHCRFEPLVARAYRRWVDAGRQAVVLKPSELDDAHGCECPMHAALRGLQSVLVHGIHDKRSSCESLFIAMSAGSLAKGRGVLRSAPLVDLLIAQIDAAFRKVPALSLGCMAPAQRNAASVLELSTRELEVLESICIGKTNLDIAAALDISPFTVKNHVQRIFRKIGVSNRTQAAARYREATREPSAKLEDGTPETQTSQAA